MPDPEPMTPSGQADAPVGAEITSAQNPAAYYPWRLKLAILFTMLPLIVLAADMVFKEMLILRSIITRHFFFWLPIVGFYLAMHAFHEIRSANGALKGRDLSIAIMVEIYVAIFLGFTWVVYNRELYGRAIVFGFITFFGAWILAHELTELSRKPAKLAEGIKAESIFILDAICIAMALGKSFLIFQFPFQWATNISGWLLVALVIITLVICISAAVNIFKRGMLTSRPVLARILIILLVSIPMGGVAVLESWGRKVLRISPERTKTGKIIEKPDSRKAESGKGANQAAAIAN